MMPTEAASPPRAVLPPSPMLSSRPSLLPLFCTDGVFPVTASLFPLLGVRVRECPLPPVASSSDLHAKNRIIRHIYYVREISRDYCERAF